MRRQIGRGLLAFVVLCALGLGLWMYLRPPQDHPMLLELGPKVQVGLTSLAGRTEQFAWLGSEAADYEYRVIEYAFQQRPEDVRRVLDKQFPKGKGWVKMSSLAQVPKGEETYVKGLSPNAPAAPGGIRELEYVFLCGSVKAEEIRREAGIRLKPRPAAACYVYSVKYVNRSDARTALR